MPVLVLADLHLDLWLRAGRDPLANLDPDLLSSLDALIVAGDLSDAPQFRWPLALQHLGNYVPPARIHVVPGNHDYYRHTIEDDDRLAEICADAGAHLAQKAEIITGDTRYLCCTLWTDFMLSGNQGDAMKRAQGGMNDYLYVRNSNEDGRWLLPTDTARVHTDHRAWLASRLADPFQGRTMVVTHHCPHPEMIGATPEELAPAYGSNLLPLIKQHRPDAWLFGHTHHRVDSKVGQTVIRNVSLGYPWQVSRGSEAVTLMRGCSDHWEITSRDPTGHGTRKGQA
ncbi:metallophosphoesterase [Paracoccus sp. NGMCC 1.201697]|uniref:Metallophosphoesterase n=1 Tax=Paracoccus broussonetiae subsp. drimophilus TaxID=3373869 RepID=A0ABW7LJU1_9RHOB